MKSLLSQLRREDDEAEKTFGERLQNMEREKDRKLDELDGQVLDCYTRMLYIIYLYYIV